MSFTYNGDPSESPTTQVRFLVGDINETHREFEDEEIEYLLTQNGDGVVQTAIDALETLAARYARKPSFSMEGASVSYASVAAAYQSRADSLQNSLRQGGLQAIWVEPVNQHGEKRDYIFEIGQHDYHLAEEDDEMGVG